MRRSCLKLLHLYPDIFRFIPSHSFDVPAAEAPAETGLGVNTSESWMARGLAIAGQTKPRRSAMKTIISALIALSLLGLVTPPASAFDTKTFWDQQDRSRY